MNNSNWVYSFWKRGTWSKVVILWWVHWNELSWVEIIEKLKVDLSKEKINWEIVLIIANNNALKKNVRFVDVDMNRILWTESLDLIRSNNDLNSEEKRVLEIIKYLDNVDYLLDIHSTIKKSVAFIYTENLKKHIMLSEIFNTEFVVSPDADFRPKDFNSSFDNYCDKNWWIWLTYESGWHKQQTDLDEIYEKVKIYLKTINSSFLNFLYEEKSFKGKRIDIYDQVIIKSDNFSFTKDFNNFDFIKKGDILAEDWNNKIIINQDSYIIFPKLILKKWNIACYLAK